MSNPVKGEVSFESGGKTYTFKMGTNAQVLLEHKTGMSMAKFLKSDRLEDIGASGVRLILWAGLTRNHPGLTEEAAGDIIDDLGAERVAKIFTEAFQAARVKGNGSDANPPQPAKAPIGMDS